MGTCRSLIPQAFLAAATGALALPALVEAQPGAKPKVEEAVARGQEWLKKN